MTLQARACPVCQLEGVETNLGNMPYHHHRLQFDFTLADLIRKLFPRPEVERQIEERRADERRFMEQGVILCPSMLMQHVPIEWAKHSSAR